jgi:hypothetical protein
MFHFEVERVHPVIEIVPNIPTFCLPVYFDLVDKLLSGFFVQVLSRGTVPGFIWFQAHQVFQRGSELDLIYTEAFLIENSVDDVIASFAQPLWC